jgi:orotidine-5'-phosphate decarboxylase
MSLDRIYVALDVEAERIRPLIDQLPPGTAYKVGMEAYFRDGARLVHELNERGHPVFLDLKLHDIPNTVSRAVGVLAALGIRHLTVHAGGGPEMLAAAVEAAGDRLRLLGVTLLTSLTGDEFGDLWNPDQTAEDRVMRLASIAVEAGCHGVVCSPREAARLRAALGSEPDIVCPGIRLPGHGLDDQRRVASPGAAIRDGASHLVVGRPITGAEDPIGVHHAVLEAVAGAR